MMNRRSFDSFWEEKYSPWYAQRYPLEHWWVSGKSASMESISKRFICPGVERWKLLSVEHFELNQMLAQQFTVHSEWRLIDEKIAE